RVPPRHLGRAGHGQRRGCRSDQGGDCPDQDREHQGNCRAKDQAPAAAQRARDQAPGPPAPGEGAPRGCPPGCPGQGRPPQEPCRAVSGENPLKTDSMPGDIYTEPVDFDLDTLRNLGPLRALAGTWEGQGRDLHPVAAGSLAEPYIERMIFEPIDPQTNGPQLLYGLRYHLHINNLDEQLPFHEQVGYWLWEPATKPLLQTVAIPRGLVAMASGVAEPDARTFTVKAVLGSATAGIISARFLDANFKTV